MVQLDRLGLALSGGGFRATLFHLGVVRALRERDLLRRVHHVASVSGGSIIAVHLALNWARYTGSDEEFEAAAGELVSFVQSDVRGGILRDWVFRHVAVLPALLRWKSSRITQLYEERYRLLYRGAVLGDIVKNADAPRISVLATSFTSGGLCAFDAEGVTFDVHRKDKNRIATGQLQASIAVAASSAFPPLFPPIPVTRKALNASQEQFPNTQYVGDGGVFDNLGVRMLAILHDADAASFDGVILSDAGAKIDTDIASRYRFIVSRSIRTSDVLMQRVSDLEYDGVAARFGLSEDSLFRIRIDQEIPARAPLALDGSIQRAIAQIRTDLDAFSPLEIATLLQHGQALAHFSLGGTSPDTKPWMPKPIAPQQPQAEIASILAKSARHRLRAWSARDLASWGLAAVLFLVIASIVALNLFNYFHTVETESDLTLARLGKSASETRLAKQQVRTANATRLSIAATEQKNAVLAQLVRTETERMRPATEQATAFDRLFRDRLQYDEAVVSITNGDRGRGTGFFINDRGYILTANHVIQDQTKDVLITLPDGLSQRARFIGHDEASDLAVLHVNAPRAVPLPLGIDSELRETPIVVLAHVFGDRRLTANAGVVKAVRAMQIELLMSTERRLVGGSGGPIVDPATGTVIGIYQRTAGPADIRRRYGTRVAAVRSFLARKLPDWKSGSVEQFVVN